MVTVKRPPGWLELFSDNKSYFDPRSLEVHSTVAGWAQTSSRTLLITGFDPMPSDPVDRIYKKKSNKILPERCPSPGREFDFEPLQLEAVPTMRTPDNSLFGLRTRIRQNTVLGGEPPSAAREKRQRRPSISSDWTLCESEARDFGMFGNFEGTSYPGYIGNGISQDDWSEKAFSEDTLVEETDVKKLIMRVLKRKLTGAKKLCSKVRDKFHH
ncbi:hypothetical protein PENDEC_c001G00476 [Penicillium decumbens]|uniref:Uncharacterized protein n=1 Tax=Penicillium decumbens TaxID=69771 RepID=A0A1V6PMP9_PENDC|nr:hypothetical protein PENDEC_c001G00476 [Penicillium decumbens]